MSDTAGAVGGIRSGSLGFWYRIGWRVNYALLTVYGPPTLGGRGEPDPRTLMRADREARRLSRLAGTSGRPVTGADGRVVCGLAVPRPGPATELSAQDPSVDDGAGDGPSRAA